MCRFPSPLYKESQPCPERILSIMLWAVKCPLRSTGRLTVHLPALFPIRRKKISGASGLGRVLFSIQAFDQYAIESLMKDYNHIEVSAGFYANPHNLGTAVNLLDVVVSGATEVDLNFNINVNTHSDGVLQYPTGGHFDTAAGAKLTIIMAPLLRGRIPVVVDDVVVVSTPGERVDAIVTDHGIAVNPRRQDLIDQLNFERVPLKTIEELRDIAYGITGRPQKPQFTDKIVALIEYRDGTLIDVL